MMSILLRKLCRPEVMRRLNENGILLSARQCLELVGDDE